MSSFLNNKKRTIFVDNVDTSVALKYSKNYSSVIFFSDANGSEALVKQEDINNGEAEGYGDIYKGGKLFTRVWGVDKAFSRLQIGQNKFVNIRLSHGNFGYIQLFSDTIIWEPTANVTLYSNKISKTDNIHNNSVTISAFSTSPITLSSVESINNASSYISVKSNTKVTDPKDPNNPNNDDTDKANDYSYTFTLSDKHIDGNVTNYAWGQDGDDWKPKKLRFATNNDETTLVGKPAFIEIIAYHNSFIYVGPHNPIQSRTKIEGGINITKYIVNTESNLDFTSCNCNEDLYNKHYSCLSTTYILLPTKWLEKTHIVMHIRNDNEFGGENSKSGIQSTEQKKKLLLTYKDITKKYEGGIYDDLLTTKYSLLVSDTNMTGAEIEFTESLEK